MRSTWGKLTAGVLAIGLAVAPAAPAGTAAAASATPFAVAGGWREIAKSPLSPRVGATALWTGREVLVLGGLAHYCARPESADCDFGEIPSYDDGAAYNPAKNTWRRIASVPDGLGGQLVIAGGTVYALGTSYDESESPVSHTFGAYSIADDTWSELPPPPDGTASLGLVGIGRYAVAYQQFGAKGGDFVWDPKVGKWGRLPVAPKGLREPSAYLDVRGDAVVVGGAGEPRFARLDMKTRTWHKLPTTTGVDQYDRMVAAAGRLVAPRVPNGSVGGILDPRGAGRWSAFPKRPRHPSVASLRGALVGGGDWVVVDSDALNVRTRKWQPIPAKKPLYHLDYWPTTVWAGDRFFIWGGQTDDGGRPDKVRNRGWTWKPAG